jgi:hypothetical protein
MKKNMKILPFFMGLAFLSTTLAYAEDPVKEALKPEGWSFDIGGTYTWMSFSTPPTYKGSTGGAKAAITYQKPWEAFGQARSFYNAGSLSGPKNSSHIHEWYTELVGGYCFPVIGNWSITPYAGLGVDFLHDRHTKTSSLASISLRYSLYYAVAGIDTRYFGRDWMVGVQADCLPFFNEYLNIKSLSGLSWILGNRVGTSVRIPMAYRFVKNYWLEFTPYYRKVPIGTSDNLGFPHRNLTQWGAFLTFRFFI